MTFYEAMLGVYPWWRRVLHPIRWRRWKSFANFQ